MTREDLDNILEELTHEDITTERQLEIFSKIQSNFDEQVTTIKDLTDSSAKLQADYMTLKQKSVNDFFHIGRESEKAKKEFNKDNHDVPIEGQVTIDDILED